MASNSIDSKINLRIYEGEDFELYFQALIDPLIQEGGGMFVPIGDCREYPSVDDSKKNDSIMNEYKFLIENSGGKAIGSALLLNIDWQNKNAKVAIAIWSPENRGKGYGTLALMKLLKYAFEELKLHRISLHDGIFEFNQQAMALYKKCGFRIEGIRRQEYFHDGRWWDVVEMAILEDYYIKLKKTD